MSELVSCEVLASWERQAQRGTNDAVADAIVLQLIAEVRRLRAEVARLQPDWRATVGAVPPSEAGREVDAAGVRARGVAMQLDCEIWVVLHRRNEYEGWLPLVYRVEREAAEDFRERRLAEGGRGEYRVARLVPVDAEDEAGSDAAD